jgi:tetratricopeptide (TPR) repeat protein
MKALHFSRSFLRFLFATVWALPATTQAQSEVNKPYDLTIVVHVAENRLLTDVFRKRIERELHDGFQAALGDMGRVTVTNEHPRLPDVLARGLRSLDDWKDHSDRKTHFVLIDYTGAHYEIQTRQYDGTISRPSPVVRFDRTRDRDFVAKAAALLIKQDFGILGTVVSEPEGAKKQVRIELRGGGLGDMTHWVKKDDVFALAPPEGGMMESLKWSFLQVEQAPTEARDGVCLCRFFHRYRLSSIAGYRCIKLGTVQTLLRIRWMQRQKVRNVFKIKPLDSPILVEVRRYGFENEDSTKLELPSDANGFWESVDKGKEIVFHNVAFVRVASGLGDGPDSHPQVPIALVDNQPVIIEVNAPTSSADTLFTISKSTWQFRVADSVQMQAALFKRLEALGVDPKNRSEIIKAAASGMKRARADRAKLLEERENLAKEAKKVNQDLKTPIADGHLKQLEEYEQALEKFIVEQQKIEETENDPQRKKWLSEIERAKLLEKELEYGKAIEIYEHIQQEGFKDADLDKHVEDLHKDWDIHNAEHEEARGFIYRVWPTLDSSRLEENIPKARKAFQTCKNVRDRLGIRKLLRGTLAHADQMEKKLAELRPDLVLDDEKEALQLKKVSEQIVKLGEELQQYLNILKDK